jgi:cbb3-type cytochrome oxidase subunit 3
MSLTEIMSNAGLARYAELALVLFVFAFIVILVRVYWPSNREKLEKQARMPLKDDQDPPNSDAG